MSELNGIFREFALAFIGRFREDRDIAKHEALRRDLLDGTLDSLKEVDRYLSALHREADSLGDAEWKTTVLWCGAYIGEVIRHETDGAFQWVDYNDYIPSHPTLVRLIPERTTATCAFIVLPDGFMSMPLNKVARYIADGEENNTHFYASCDIKRARGPAA